MGQKNSSMAPVGIHHHHHHNGNPQRDVDVDEAGLLLDHPEWAATALTPRRQREREEEFEALADEVRRVMMMTTPASTKGRRRPSLHGSPSSSSSSSSSSALSVTAPVPPTASRGLVRLVKRQNTRNEAHASRYPRTATTAVAAFPSSSASAEQTLFGSSGDRVGVVAAMTTLSDEAEFLYDMGKRMLLGREGGMELQRNPLRAVHFLRRAAALGHIGAKWDLHCCRGEGEDITLDYSRAVVLYARFAKMGHPVALSNLGVCYHKGRGVRKSLSKAVHYYSQAAKLNYARGSYNLAVCYDLGEGVAKDAIKAVELYRRSADQGYAVAQYYMGVCYNHAKGLESRDFKKAVRMWRKAAKQGHGLARLVLANYHREGQDLLEKDILKAAFLYRSSVEWGDEKAWERLKDLLGSGEFEECREEKSEQRNAQVPSLFDQCCLHYFKRWTHHKTVPTTKAEQDRLPSEVVERITSGVQKCHNPHCTTLFFGPGMVTRSWRVKPEPSDAQHDETEKDHVPENAQPGARASETDEDLVLERSGENGDEVTLHFCCLNCSKAL